MIISSTGLSLEDDAIRVAFELKLSTKSFNPSILQCDTFVKICGTHGLPRK